MSVEVSEYLDPRRYNQSVPTITRHIQRYLRAVSLLGMSGKGQQWLDFGCGSGYGTSILKNYCPTVVGYDPIYQKPIDARTDVLLVGHLPEYKFDAVFCIEVIEHVSQVEAPALLKQMKSVTKKKGWIVISTPIKLPHQKVTNPHHKHEYTLPEFETLIATNGLIIQRSQVVSSEFTDGSSKKQGIFVIK